MLALGLEDVFCFDVPHITPQLGGSSQRDIHIFTPLEIRQRGFFVDDRFADSLGLDAVHQLRKERTPKKMSE